MARGWPGDFAWCFLTISTVIVGQLPVQCRSQKPNSVLTSRPTASAVISSRKIVVFLRDQCFEYTDDDRAYQDFRQTQQFLIDCGSIVEMVPASGEIFILTFTSIFSFFISLILLILPLFSLELFYRYST